MSGDDVIGRLWYHLRSGTLVGDHWLVFCRRNPACEGVGWLWGLNREVCRAQCHHPVQCLQKIQIVTRRRGALICYRNTCFASRLHASTSTAGILHHWQPILFFSSSKSLGVFFKNDKKLKKCESRNRLFHPRLGNGCSTYVQHLSRTSDSSRHGLFFRVTVAGGVLAAGDYIYPR